MTQRQAAFVQFLDDLCTQSPAVAERREMLLLMLGCIEKLEANGIMDAVIQSQGYLNTISDVASQSLKFVWNNGWSLGFEGEGGEMVILIAAIRHIRPRKTGYEVEMETGETIWLRFHGQWRSDPTN